MIRGLAVPLLLVAALAVAGLAATGAAPGDEDAFAWLEDVQGEKALAWAKEHNAKSTAVFCVGGSMSMRTTFSSGSPFRIASPTTRT